MLKALLRGPFHARAAAFVSGECLPYIVSAQGETTSVIPGISAASLIASPSRNELRFIVKVAFSCFIYGCKKLCLYGSMEMCYF